MQLPELFEEKMKGLLGAEYEDFLAGYEKERHQALRVNPAKISAEEFARISPFTLEPVPWAKNGFYYGTEDRPGRHPWHEAGVYYIQEPSAMSVAELAGVQPGDRVLDLCAAPGGKSTQLAAAMEGRGLLISNEIHPARAKILSSNIERMGILNAVVTNEAPERLAPHFPAFFDRIVVDAPCSGEGMFRKEEQAVSQWSQDNVDLCAKRQQDILEEAAKMLRSGGVLVYSTCTFAPEEDEESIVRFLLKHPEFSVKKTEAYEGFAPGRPEWVKLTDEEKESVSVERLEAVLASVKDTFRLWPHKLNGEGHYAAVLEKADGNQGEELSTLRIEKTERKNRKNGKSSGKSGVVSAEAEAWKLYREFAADTLVHGHEGIPMLFGEQLYLLPCELNLEGLKVLRSGLHLGTVKKNRFEPAHALALALKAEDVKRSISYGSDSREIRAWLSGESLEGSDGRGWTLVQTDGFSLGWGKQAGGILKNHYPKGLRKQ